MSLRLDVWIATAISAILFFLVMTSTESTLATECAIANEDGKIVVRGEGRVEDGDTIWVGIHKIRLYGIEALEEDQPCHKDNERQNCAERSIQALSDLIAGHTIKCKIDIGKRGEPIMSYNRYLAICYLSDGTELNRRLVRDGWVLADPSVKGDMYRGDEKFAAERAFGIHSSNFISPKEYRRSKYDASEPCPTDHQCVRSNRTDIEELLKVFKNKDPNQ